MGVVAAGIPARNRTSRSWTVHGLEQLPCRIWDLEVVVDLTDQAPADFMAALGGHDAAPWLLGLALLLLLVEIQLGRGAGCADRPAPVESPAYSLANSRPVRFLGIRYMTKDVRDIAARKVFRSRLTGGNKEPVPCGTIRKRYSTTS